MAEFGEILNFFREEKDIGQKELAELLHLTKGSISNYEKGKFEPDIAAIKVLANFFEVSTDYLLGYSEDPASYKTLRESFSGTITFGEVLHMLAKIRPEYREGVLQMICAISKYSGE